jgi:hypothetical protein
MVPGVELREGTLTSTTSIASSAVAAAAARAGATTAVSITLVAIVGLGVIVGGGSPIGGGPSILLLVDCVGSVQVFLDVVEGTRSIHPLQGKAISQISWHRSDEERLEGGIIRRLNRSMQTRGEGLKFPHSLPHVTGAEIIGLLDTRLQEFHHIISWIRTIDGLAREERQGFSEVGTGLLILIWEVLLDDGVEGFGEIVG